MALSKKRAFFISLMLFLSSCGSTRTFNDSLSHFVISDNDYVDHLESLAKDYLLSPGVREKKLSTTNAQYLENLYNRIVLNNELILKKKLKPMFHIINSEHPFYFSLPSGHFFMSDTLIRKYIKSENLLVSLLANDIYRMHKGLYEKKILIPVGFTNTKQMLSLYKIPLAVKIESLKWTYFLLQRSGYDAYSVLSWIQTQNKSSLEFSIQQGNAQAQTREEFLFKSFLAQEIGGKQPEGDSSERNSSLGFYKLQRSLL